jgi:23S rRNA (cytosine1962-C5)-methyltransferase
MKIEQPTKARFPRMILKADSLKRIKRGHRWIFSNEIQLVEPEAVNGGVVAVVDSNGSFLGSALYSKNALIAGRVYSHRSVEFDGTYIESALLEAEERRRLLLPHRTTYRLAYGDSDGLPGIVVDRYEDVLVLQLLTVSAELRRDLITDCLQSLFAPKAIVERSDTSGREWEGLPEVKGVLRGTMENPFIVNISGIKLTVDVLEGQKTGLYLDQAENWSVIRPWVKGGSVLDLFSHAGGWSLNAALGGAASVVAVDQSAGVLEGLGNCWVENGFAPGTLEAHTADVFDYLRKETRLFEVVVCDPPAFAKNRKAVPGALRGYQDVNRLAMKRVAPQGFLVSCSCSHNVEREDFLQCLRMASRDAQRDFQLLEIRSQPADHPPLLGVPETEYLKVVVLKALS